MTAIEFIKELQSFQDKRELENVQRFFCHRSMGNSTIMVFDFNNTLWFASSLVGREIEYQNSRKITAKQ